MLRRFVKLSSRPSRQMHGKMCAMADHLSFARYFPAIVYAEFHSPVDALCSLCVSHDEAMNLVVAAWYAADRRDRNQEIDGRGERHEWQGCTIVTTIDGGRCVAALPLENGRWAACYVYLGQATASCAEAERRLRKLVRGKKRGLVGCVDAASPD